MSLPLSGPMSRRARATMFFAADALQSRVEHRVTIRRNAAVIVGMRVAVGALTLSIAAILDDGSPLITLICEELP
jgi:head-tail adaptor